MKDLQGSLRGRKVYILGLVAVVGAVAAYLTGDLSLEQAIETAWVGGMAMAFRAAVAKVGGGS
jgi:hypothetical protein